MKVRKERTFWRMLSQPNTIPMPEFIRRFFRSSPGRGLTKRYRTSPRAPVYLVLLTLLLALANQGKGPYEKLTYEAWTGTIYDLRYGIFSMLPANVTLLVGVLASLLMMVLFGTIAGMGIDFTCNPKCSKRRRMKLLQRGAYACTLVSLVAIAVIPSTLAFANAERLNQERAYNAGFLMWKLDKPTVKRIVDEERAGHWWADPDDSDMVKEIKTAWMRTGNGGREVLEKLARDRLAMHPRREPLQ